MVQSPGWTAWTMCATDGAVWSGRYALARSFSMKVNNAVTDTLTSTLVILTLYMQQASPTHSPIKTTLIHFLYPCHATHMFRKCLNWFETSKDPCFNKTKTGGDGIFLRVILFHFWVLCISSDDASDISTFLYLHRPPQHLSSEWHLVPFQPGEPVAQWTYTLKLIVE